MKSISFISYLLFTVVFIHTTFGQGFGGWGGFGQGAPQGGAPQGGAPQGGGSGSVKPIKNKNPLITHRYSADPGVMVYNGRVYVYATNDGDVSDQGLPAKNEYNHIKSINVMSSDDLVNWMDHGPIPVAGNIAKWANNSWAPCAAHKTINGKEKFFIYYANSGAGIGVLTSDSPIGPWTDPLGKALVSPQTPTCNTVKWLFDPAVLVDDDGTGYLYFGGGVPDGQSANPKTVRVVKLGPDMISLAGTPQVIDAPWVFEDSGIHKMGNTYVYSYCTNFDNGPYGNGKIAYMTSNSPMGPFTYKGTCFDNPSTYFGIGGNNHHTIIGFNNKYYIFYHTQWLNQQVKNGKDGYRTTHVDEMPSTGNGLGNAKGTLDGVAQVKNVDGSALNYAASMAWQSGIKVEGNNGVVTKVKYSANSWTGVSNVNLGNAKSITLKASSQSGATIKICTGSESGQAIGSVQIPAGGSLQNVTGNLTGATGTANLFFVASGDATIESWQMDGTPSAGGNTAAGNTADNTTAGNTNTGNVAAGNTTPAPASNDNTNANTNANPAPANQAPVNNDNSAPANPAPVNNDNSAPAAPAPANDGGNSAPAAPADNGGNPFGGAPWGGAPANDGGNPFGGAPWGGAPADNGGNPFGGAPWGGAPAGNGGNPWGGAPAGNGGNPFGGAPWGGAPWGGAPTNNAAAGNPFGGNGGNPWGAAPWRTY